MKLDDALSGVTRLAIDTPAIIYFIEAHPRYDSLVTAMFQKIAAGRLLGITSAITLTEVLVLPYIRGDAKLQQAYRNLLLGTDNFEVASVDVVAAERAAALRARYHLRTPDALQVAVALTTGCEAFITNDATLKRISELQVLMLSQLEV